MPDDDPKAPMMDTKALAEVAYINSKRGAKREAQRKQPTDVDPNEAARFFKPLGHHRGTFYFFSASGGQVIAVRVSQLSSKPVLLSLAPLRWWEQRFSDGEGFKGAAIDAAVDWLIYQCYGAGVFQLSRLRGRGAWWDDGIAVFHAGDRLVVDGSIVALDGYASRYVYEALPALPLSESPLSESQCHDLLRMCLMLRWTKRAYGWQLAGWIVCASVCGALEWRPHVWVTGPKGCGKSWVVSKVVRAALGGFALAVQGSTSAAGIRQSLGQDARPVVFDEAEGEDQHQAESMQGVLALMRQASTDDGGEIVKGGQSGEATSYTIRSAFCLSSIVPQLRAAADESRVNVLTLLAGTGTKDERAQFELIRGIVGSLFVDGFPERLQRFVLQHLGEIRANTARLAAVLSVRIGSQRQADQLAPMAAGAYALSNPGRIMSDDEAASWAGRVDVSEATEIARQRDEMRLLSMILESILEVVTDTGLAQRRTVAETVYAAHTRRSLDMPADVAERALARVGLRVHDGRLYVSQSHRAISAMLRGSAWSSGWHRVLSRIDGAEAGVQVRFGPISQRAVSIPIDFAIQDDRI